MCEDNDHVGKMVVVENEKLSETYSIQKKLSCKMNNKLFNQEHVPDFNTGTTETDSIIESESCELAAKTAKRLENHTYCCKKENKPDRVDYLNTNLKKEKPEIDNYENYQTADTQQKYNIEQVLIKIEDTSEEFEMEKEVDEELINDKKSNIDDSIIERESYELATKTAKQLDTHINLSTNLKEEGPEIDNYENYQTVETRQRKYNVEQVLIKIEDTSEEIEMKKEINEEFIIKDDKFDTDGKINVGFKKKSNSMSADQKKALVDFVESHTDLKNGKFTKEFTYKKAQLLWEELAIKLNSIPGVEKDWKQWRKASHDLRCHARAKKSKIIKEQRATGGGSSTEQELTHVDEKIVAIIDSKAIEGHPNIRESCTSFNFEDMDLAFIPSIGNQEDSQSIVTPVSDALVTPQTLKTEPPKAIRSKAQQGVKRLDQTIAATSKLVEINKKKLEIKEKYYKKKIKLYERNVLAKERDVRAKERIAVCLEKLIYNSRK